MAKKIMLDTDILFEYFAKNLDVLNFIETANICISSVTQAEIVLAAYNKDIDIKLKNVLFFLK